MLKNSLQIVIIFLMTVNVLSTCAQVADSLPKTPSTQWIRQRNVDVQHIALDLNFDWKKKQTFGTAMITASLLNSSSKMYLDAGFLKINSIKRPNGSSLVYSYDGSDKDDALQIELGRIYKAGEKIVFTIDYQTSWVNETDPFNIWGSFGKGLRFLEPSFTEPQRKRQIWSMGEPQANRYWFPGYDFPDDLRTIEIKATVEKSLYVVSNGNLINITSNQNGTKTFHWKMDVAHPNHLTSLVIAEFVDIQQKYKNTTLHSYTHPIDSTATVASIDRLPDMATFFSDYTTVSLPYKNYSQVFVQESPGAMANASTSTITENMIDDDRTHADFLYLWDIVEGEALASQWFVGVVTARDWSDIWLNKAMARYFSGLYNEYKNGRDEFLLYQHFLFDNSTYFGDWNAGVRMPVVMRNYESTDLFVAGNAPYVRGALVLHTLREYLGTDVWKKAIQLYLTSNAGKSVTTSDFIKAVEQASNKPMQWFFDQWVYRTGHPIFEITKSFDATKKALTLTINQTQKPEANSIYEQTNFYQGTIDIEFEDRVERVWLEPKVQNVFTFTADQNPKLVNVDYEGAWIKELIFQKSLDELIYQFENTKGIISKRQTMLELVRIARGEKTSVTDKNKIYASIRSVIQSKTYWKFRFQAIGQLQSLIGTSTEANPAKLDKETTTMLVNVIKNEKAWVKANAITFLGMTRDVKYTDIYLVALNDVSDRVINTAAIALGRTKSPKAYDALIKLKDKPSWKNQSLISALNGLRELKDPRGVDLALRSLTDSNAPHWTLAVIVWDHRLTAAETLVALGKADKGYDAIKPQLKKAVEENNVNDIFYNLLQVAMLGDARGQELFDEMKAHYKDDANALAAVESMEGQFQVAVKK